MKITCDVFKCILEEQLFKITDEMSLVLNKKKNTFLRGGNGFFTKERAKPLKNIIEIKRRNKITTDTRQSTAINSQNSP